MINLSNLPIVLYLIAIPLISSGTTGANPVLTWLGFGALFIGGAITPGLRFAGEKDYPIHALPSEEEEIEALGKRATMINLTNLPIVLYLIAIPLISSGTTGANPVLMWLGFGALFIGGAITPGLRFAGEKDYPMGSHPNKQEKKNV